MQDGQLTVPIFQSTFSSTDMTTPLPTAVDTTVLRLLYVEDNRVNAMLFSAMLTQRGGVDLQIAEDAAEALALVGEWTPDVLVLDANLPDMNGYELLGALRSRLGMTQIPAFMCSADAQAEDIAKAMNSGFTGFWPKPIDIRQVLLDLLPYAREASDARDASDAREASDARDASDSRDASGGHTHTSPQPA